MVDIVFDFAEIKKLVRNTWFEAEKVEAFVEQEEETIIEEGEQVIVQVKDAQGLWLCSSSPDIRGICGAQKYPKAFEHCSTNGYCWYSKKRIKRT